MIDLDEATRALRDESDGASVGAGQTRARIMRSLHEGTHRRRVRWGFGVPLAVIFAGSTAFAGARGDLGETVAEAFSSVRALVTGAPAEAPRAAAPARGSVAAVPAAPPEAPPTAPEAVAAVPEAEPPAAPPAQVREVTPPPATEHRAGPSLDNAKPRPSAVVETPSANVPTESNEATRLYRKAHEAQFVQADCERALSAYDEYLASAPRDRLVPEARYNRALCLVRLGRTDAARSALQPFADGAYGDFRRREARELLDALGAK